MERSLLHHSMYGLATLDLTPRRKGELGWVLGGSSFFSHVIARVPRALLHDICSGVGGWVGGENTRAARE